MHYFAPKYFLGKMGCSMHYKDISILNIVVLVKWQVSNANGIIEYSFQMKSHFHIVLNEKLYQIDFEF